MTMPDHLGDEQISAFIDGASDAAGARDVTSHISACATCRARLDRLTRVRELVAGPVAAITQPDVDALIDAAVRAAVPAGKVARLDGRRRRGATLPVWLGAAAAVAVVLLAVPLLLRSGGSDGTLAATAPGAEGDTQEFTTDADRAPAGAGTSTASAADAVGETVQPEGASALRADSTEAAPAPGLGAYEADSELIRRLVAELSTTAGGAGEGRPATCEDAARSVGGSRLGGLVYVNALVWRGQEAEVVVFAMTEPTGGDTRQAYVMERSGCGLLAEPRF